MIAICGNDNKKPQDAAVFLLFGGLKDQCRCSQGNNCPVFNNNPLPVTKNSIEQECTGQTRKISERITDVAGLLFFYSNDTVPAVHTSVIRVNGNCNMVSRVVTSYYVLTFMKRKVLTESKHILYNSYGAESNVINLLFTVCIFLSGRQLAGTNTYPELFAAVLTFKYQ